MKIEAKIVAEKLNRRFGPYKRTKKIRRVQLKLQAVGLREEGTNQPATTAPSTAV
ncbi:hypothetical protein CCACVL1_22315 [Corchorus capsularis]|uniref:Uncharacterized protein n=1 Tax=Corchorus capsularis TaxID=210143 RepID=A0A1R3H0G7_COCAP|nr:hypothetical protein CCACVL1_22315 [Corchorus capsularis]